MKVDSIMLSQQLRMLEGVDKIKPITPRGISEVETPNSQKVSFGEFMAQQFQQANEFGVAAEQAIQDKLAGKEANPHSALIAVQKASISMTLMMGVKQHLERAYQELIRMQLG